jgi:hypothetical protein
VKIRCSIAVAISCAFGIVACDKSPASSSDAAPPSSASSAATVASSAAPAPSASSSANANAGAASGAWAGSYKSAPGTFYYPTDAPNGKEWKDFKWQGDDAGVGLGDGTLSVTVDAEGKVTGGGEGALGAFTLNGTLENGQLSAKVDRKDPSDRGLTGTALGKMNGDKLEGAMRLSLPEANVLRTAAFSLSKGANANANANANK